MKKLLFLLIAFLAWGTSAYSQEFIKGMEISLYGDIKKDNNVDPEDMPQTRHQTYGQSCRWKYHQ